MIVAVIGSRRSDYRGYFSLGTDIATAFGRLFVAAEIDF